MERQIRRYILEFLNRVYPDSLTIKFIEALLYDWQIYTTEEELKRGPIKYLLKKGYIEIDSVRLPTTPDRIERIRLTEKGKALLSREIHDRGIDMED